MPKEIIKVTPTPRQKRALIRLQNAAANWVKSYGGRVVVVGNAQIQTWPGETPFNFIVGVKCTGRSPTPFVT